MNFIYWFVSTGWLYLMICIGIFLTIWLAIHWKRYNWQNRLGTLAIIVLCFHVMEEWVFPGGFHFIYNLNADNPLDSSSNYPMSQLTDMITNLGGAIIGMMVFFIWGLNDGAGIAIAIFSLFEAVIHVFLASKSLSAFRPYGQTSFYAPGLITALGMFLPIFIAYLINFIFRKKKPSWKAWVGGIASLGVLSFLLVNLPEMLLKSEDSPFSFTSHDYYDQFINGTYQIGMTGGTIAAIIVLSLLVAALISICIYYFAIKKRKWSDLTNYFRRINNPEETKKEQRNLIFPNLNHRKVLLRKQNLHLYHQKLILVV